MLDPVNLLSERGDRGAGAPEDVMNWSMYTADRGTHLKIVVVGLAAALLIAVIGISARQLNLGVDIMTAQSPSVIKAGGPVVFSDRNAPTVR
jgi:hypothetical protein